MSKRKVSSLRATSVGVALVGSLSLAGGLQAAANPFEVTELGSGYLLASAPEGKCGGEAKSTEAKCGGKMKTSEGSPGAEAKSTEGKCGGEKKSAEGKCGGEKKSAEGKCGGK